MPRVFHADHGNQDSTGGGFTSLELLVVIGTAAVVATLLTSSLLQTKAAARATICRSNLREMGMALEEFTDQFNVYPLRSNPDLPKGKYIEHRSGWFDAINNIYFHQPLFDGKGQALLNKGIFSCPSAIESRFPTNWDFIAYGYNAHGLGGANSQLGLGGLGTWTPEYRPTPKTDVVSPGAMMAIGDGFRGWNDRFIEADLFSRNKAVMLSPEQGGTTRSWNRHNGKANVVFCDGHTGSITFKTLFADISEQKLGPWNKDNQPHPEMLQ